MRRNGTWAVGSPVDEVMEAARSKGIEDVSQVKLGILEADGSFSFIRYDGR